MKGEDDFKGLIVSVLSKWLLTGIFSFIGLLCNLKTIPETCLFTSFVGEDVPPMQLKEGVFRCIMQLYDCLLTEVHERCKKGLGLAKYLNSSLAFFCYDLLSIIEPRQVFELVCLLLYWSPWSYASFFMPRLLSIMLCYVFLSVFIQFYIQLGQIVFKF